MHTFYCERLIDGNIVTVDILLIINLCLFDVEFLYQKSGIHTMKAYTNMMKTIYSHGQEYLTRGLDLKKQPIVKIDKTATIHEAKAFHDSKIDPKLCIATLAKLIYLFNQGESFTEDETTSLFFSITKLFQTDNPNLRRLVYTFVKEMSNQPSIYIVTSSLLKDIHHKDCNFRRNSLRTLPLVLDPTNLVQVERYIKELMNDSDPGVVSAALLSGIAMYKTNEDIVRKWGVQVGQKLKHSDKVVQYHSLALIGDIKRKDTKFLKKILLTMIKDQPTGLAAIQHLRMMNLILQDADTDAPEIKDFINYVLRQVKMGDDSVVIEAAKIACQSPFFSNKDLLDVIKVLERFLVSNSTAKKYTVLKLYNSLLRNTSRKSLVVNVKEIQKVLNDKNVSLSSQAASILLRICSENYLEMLLKGLKKTMKEMSIEYKIDVIKSLVNVLKTYPKQYPVINDFILDTLKHEDSENLRREAIQVLGFQVTEIGGEAKKKCLQELAKFLSYAKYEKIHFQILGIINREIRAEEVTSDLLKSIINEIYLQEGSIRACGLSTLMKIAEVNVQKRKVLERTIAKFEKDRDQEVRERISFKSNEKPINSFELDMIENYLYFNCEKIQNSNDCNILGFDSIKKWGEEVGPSVLKKKKKSTSKAEQRVKQAEEEQKHYKQLFLNHSTFKAYGELRKINNRILISDPDSQLQVNVRLFLFDAHLVVEYEIENKFDNTVLENVRVDVKHSGEQFKTQHTISAKSIPIGGKGESYVGLIRLEDSESIFPEENISSILKFTAKEFNGETLKAAYEDQFSLESFDILTSTYMSGWMIEKSQFETYWKKMNVEVAQGTYQLHYASKEAAIKQLVKKFGISKVFEEEVQNSNKVSLLLAGKYLGKYRSLMNLMVGFDTKLGCVVKVVVKSEHEEVGQELVDALE